MQWMEREPFHGKLNRGISSISQQAQHTHGTSEASYAMNHESSPGTPSKTDSSAMEDNLA